MPIDFPNTRTTNFLPNYLTSGPELHISCLGRTYQQQQVARSQLEIICERRIASV